MNENTIVLIDKFADTLKQYGGDLFIIAQKQLYVEVAQFTVVGCITAVCVIASKKYLKNREPIGGYDIDVVKILICCVIGFLSLLLFINLMTIIQWIINPEYASIQTIMSLIK